MVTYQINSFYYSFLNFFMKHHIIYLALFVSFLSYTQEKKKFITPTRAINLEIFMNKDNSFNGGGVSIEPFQGQGMGMELNSAYGIVFFRKLSFSAGMGIVFNFQENLNALPLVAQLKWHFNDYDKEGTFILLNTGINIAIGNFRKGQSAKFGVGYTFETQSHLNYELSAVFKFKNYVLNNTPDIQRESVGISLGIQFN